jgi:collagenase-like PrtC family protease
MKIRLAEPVNFIRANWIRPEDLDRYEALGYTNFKIVERNTPTRALLERVHAYTQRHYEGNLADLVLAWNYAEDKFKEKESDFYSYRRLIKYFFKPRTVNLFKFWQMVDLGRHQSLLYPRRKGPSPIYIDNRKLDGFLDKWPANGCMARDCDQCRYCHKLAEKCVTIDPAFRAKALAQFDRLFEDMHTGGLWESHVRTTARAAGKVLSSGVEPHN